MTKVADLLIQLDHYDAAISKLQQLGVHGRFSADDCDALMGQLRRERDQTTSELHHQALLKRSAVIAATSGGG